MSFNKQKEFEQYLEDVAFLLGIFSDQKEAFLVEWRGQLWQWFSEHGTAKEAKKNIENYSKIGLTS